MNDDHTTSPVPPATPTSRRKPALLAVTGVVIVAGLAWGGWWALFQRHFEGTDNAYVQGPVVQITPQVGGTVLAVLADDTDIVKAGQPLVRLDPADARLALERAEAQLAQTVRELRAMVANNAVLGANVQLRQSEITRMQAEVQRASDDVNRRRPLMATGAVSGEEMKHAEATLAGARSALVSAQSALAAAQEQAASNRVLTDGTSIEKHPNVERAAAAVREAFLALQRTELPAPVSGQVARRTVQVGQRIAAGAPLMSVIPLEQVWVEANFKEVQLREMRIGQPVKLTADLYGRQVEYRGRVAGVGAGTGSAFALLPAQNATGNWIKVVQRVPVRITLDAKELADHPLRVGLSMDAKVDVSKTDGRMLADGSRASTSAQTAVFDLSNTAADAEVRKIIAANGGPAYKASAMASNARPAANTPVAATTSAAAASMATLAAGTAANASTTRVK